MTTSDPSISSIDARTSALLSRVYEMGGKIDYFAKDAERRLCEYQVLEEENRVLTAEVLVLRAQVEALQRVNQPEIISIRAS
jgi:cell shape-determining protein MreC